MSNMKNSKSFLPHEGSASSLHLLYPLAIIGMMTPEYLKHWRRTNHYSQQRLADALGVLQVTVARWETGVRKIPSFLHLALRCLELEGGEPRKGSETKTTGKEE
jgi:DNA-binding transcriptional regulator YiaG